MDKFTIITEAKRDEVWGRIQHGNALLTAVASNIDELIEQFTEQLEEHYDITATETDFEIISQADITD